MTDTPEEHIDALVQAAQAGDKSAFAELYDHLFDSIYRYVYFRVPMQEVDDIVENIFMKVWVNLEKYEKRDVRFSAWVFRIAHNAVIDYRREHRAVETLDHRMMDESEQKAPKKMTEKAILSEEVREVVDELREPYRQVVMLKFLSGLSTSEVAEILGQREGNVRVLQFRALKQLKRLLSERGFTKETL